MFSFPQIAASPIFNGIGSGTIEWPTIGAVLGFFLVAAFVGTILGMLRDSAKRSAPAQLTLVSRDAVRPVNAARLCHDHREAA